ncbi:hypothetical protein FZC66_07370 [Priestia megaterium]|nr:hypothetical protein FZC66_07370 [Priestia megaterium]
MIISTVIEVGTFVLLFLSFMLLFWSIRQPKAWKIILLSILFLLFSSPLAYLIYDDHTQNYLDANIGLGLAYLLTWFITGIIILTALFRFISLRRHH